MKTNKLLSILTALSLSSSVLATNVNVNHLAPFAADVADTAVSVNVNGTEALTGVQFLQSSGYLELAAPGVAPGETTLEVFAPPGGETPAIADTVDLAADTFYSVTAIGDGTNQPLQLLPLVDTQETPSDGNFLIRVIHAAPFAADLAATAASVRLDDGTVVNGLSSVLFGQDSGFFELPAGNYDLNVSTADGSTRLIDIAPLDLPAGVVVNVFAVGDGVNQPVGAYAVFGDGTSASLSLEATAPTRVNVAHLAPFAADLADTAVSIDVNGAEVLTGVQYTQSSGYLTLADNGQAPGDTMLEVFAPPGADTPAIMTNVNLAAETDYTVIAIGDGVNQPLNLLPLVDDNSMPAPGFAKVRVVHSAPFAANLSDTAVSIRTDNGDLVGGLTGVEYGQASGYLELPATLYDLNVATPDGSTVLIDLAPVLLKDGDIVTIFAIGDGVNQDLGFYALFGDGTGALLENDKELLTLNQGLSGAWYNPEQDGQGFLVDILPEINFAFVAWYTFDTTASDDTSAVIGNSNQRWLTASGSYTGTEAVLSVFSTQGGVFNQTDTTQSTEVGTMIVNFESCQNATVEFSLNDDSIVSSIDLTRISATAVPFCESLK
ncbi:MAG: DUF4397 domain-containing protein [Marinicellaceae bacterium]